MEKQAILFIDVDEKEYPHYCYREPHFSAARQRGFYCLIAARRGHPYPERLYADSDRVFFFDRLDEATILDLVAEINQNYRLKVLFCHAGHATRFGQPGIITANVCQTLGLHYASPDAINACNNKFVMRQRLAEHNIPSVPAILCHNKTQLIAGGEKIGYPLVAKPPFGAGSAFIKKCTTAQELIEHYAIYQREYDRSLSANFFGNSQSDGDLSNIPGATILLEGWIDGTEGSVECVATENKVYPLIINEKLIITDRTNTVLENLLITPPEKFSPADQQIIRDYAVRCLQAVGLNNTVAHFEFRMTDRGPVVIEINPRLGGLYVSSAFIDIADLNPWALYLDLLQGESEIEQRLAQAALRIQDDQNSYSMMVIYPDKEGIFKGFTDLSAVENNPNILEFGELPSGIHVSPDIEEYYLLKCWAKVANADAARSLYQELCKKAKPVIE